MVDFMTSENYDDMLCGPCKVILDQIVEMYREDLLSDTDDPEAASMWMYDHKMYCGGDTCKDAPDKK